MPYWFDGNNLIGQSTAAARENPRVRQAFLSTLSSFYKAGGGRFLVYFDGDDPGHAAVPPGISVRYSAPSSTDEIMLRRLREVQYPSEIIVVSNDRELAARCRNAGASTMTWSQFAAKMKSRHSARSTRSAPQERVDVEDWMRYFGFDESGT
jgi:predicted RNA-binding protein with PIN domain